MIIIIKNKAQTTLETVMLLILLVAGLLAMYGYLKASIQGGWKTNTDSFSDQQYQEGISTEDYDSGINISNSKIKLNLTGKPGDINLSGTEGIRKFPGWSACGENY